MALTAELVAHCERPEPDPGRDPSRRYFTDAEYEAAAARLIEQTAPGPLWVFAYGSLIWKPAIAATEHRLAVAQGWHRAFCLKLTVVGRSHNQGVSTPEVMNGRSNNYRHHLGR